MPGENEETTAAVVEAPVTQPELIVEETVPPQETEPAAETVPAETPPTETSPARDETKKKKDEAAKRRIERREWRHKLEATQNAMASEDDISAVMELAKAEGFDLKDEASKKQVQFLAKASALISNRRNQKSRTVLTEESRTNLKETLREMGYREGTAGFNTAGEHLFRKFGVENPDAFFNREMVEEELNNLAATLAPRRTVTTNPVKAAIQQKAGVPQAAAQSRSQVAAPESDATKAAAQRMRVSEGTAKTVLEAKAKLPKFLR